MGRARPLLTQARRCESADVALYTVCIYGSVAFAALASVLQARSIGAPDYGLLALATALTPFLHLLYGMGVPVSITRAASINPDRIPNLAATARRQLLITIPLALPVAFALSLLTIGSADSMAQRAALLALWAPGLGILGDTYAQLAIARKTLVRLGIIRAGPVLLVSCLNVALFLTDDLTLAWTLALLATRPVAQTIIGSALVRTPKAHPEHIGPHVSFGARAVVNQAAELGTARVDQLILAPLVGSADLARYAVCASFAGLPVALTQALVARAFPRLAIGSGSPAGLINNAFSIAMKTAVITAPLILLGVWAIPRLYGSEFTGLTSTLLTLGIATVAVAGCYGLGSGIVATGRPSLSGVGWLTGVLTTLAVLPPLAHRHGILGAALASLGAYAATFVAFVISLSVVHRRHNDAAPTSKELADQRALSR